MSGDGRSPAVPDYELADTVQATSPAQMKALGDPIRQSILTLVMDRAATTSELAEALHRPKGTVDHHLKVLERAGLITVVRTRKVRAMTERYWGRTARTIFFAAPGHEMSTAAGFIRQALAEAERIPPYDPSSGEDVDDGTFTTLRHARIPLERLHEFNRRLDDLANEFMATPRGGDTVFGLLLALYPTDRPVLPS